MRSARIVGRGVAGALLALALFVVGAGGCKKSASSPDGGDGSIGDGPTDMQPVDGRDGGTDVPPCVPGAKTIGTACGCNAECASAFCADGVCCNAACTEGCKTCAAAGSVGTCVSRPAGDMPRVPAACAMQAATTCGLDGKCDGSGACRRWPAGTTCKTGRCEGDAVVNSNVCDGTGQCRPGPTRICVPFACDPTTGDCYKTCSTNNQCVSAQQCTSASCGKLMQGASCERNDQCASEFCADGVCCNVACQGPCVACNLAGRGGICWPVDTDQPDPRGICRDQGGMTCGQTGKCDGLGSCSKYPRDTRCINPTCAGNRLNTAGTCNGLGTCQAPGLQDCSPFRCTNGACTTTCATNADCDTGIACVNNTCGPKQDGQTCLTSSECQHGFCVDGVCCDSACTGACRSCKLEATMGRCTMAAAGSADPRQMCETKPQSTCSTNGKCDGGGGCQNWPVGTLCADETCNPTGNVYKAPSQCNASGQCVAPDLQPCSPYVCNGTTRCFTACTNNSQCVMPFSCDANSCGLKENGAACSVASECRSSFCAQGVCCDTACNTACKSCISVVRGVCSNVPTGTPDPSGSCPIADQSTCGTNGKCEAGACQKWTSGTPCMPESCSTTTHLYTPLSTCDGAGTCAVPGTSPCFPYACNTTPSACKASCTVDADCLSPAVCTAGRCGLKPNGALCNNRNECLSGNCEQSVCCETACAGVCKSCALTASRGVCSNIPSGVVDLLSRCSDQGAASCGTDGFCNGNGGCRLYNAGTACAPPSCPSGQSTQTNGRTCNGTGVCQTATTLACAPYVCNGATACLAACTGDGDCLAPNICDRQTSRCGNKKRLGQPCANTTECLTGNFCTNGVCCSTSSCALCQACNVGAAAGNCANVGSGVTDSRCVASPPCGNTGACNGAGACQLAATTVSCGTQTCSGSTLTLVSRCTGTGTCAPASTQSCTPYMCGTGSCRNTCSMDSHCLAPFTCQGTAPNRVCALKPPGQACTAANQCISGSCVNGVCCALPSGSTSCGTCRTCAGTMPGMCTPLAAGTAAPAGQCAASPPCGNTGTCNGSGACTQAAATVGCGLPVSCSGTAYQPASTCTGGGACNQLPATTCGNYVCATSTTCRNDCTTDTHCGNANLYCNGTPSTPGGCVPKKANGAMCTGGNQCTSGNCVDGACCMATGCPTCQACNINGGGTCAAVVSGPEPQGRCTPNPPCGNTGTCTSGACTQGSSSTACGLPQSCSGTTYQPPSTCSGSGTCNQTSNQTCGLYVCNTDNTCRTACAGDGDCVANHYCAGTTCTPKKALGEMCTGGPQCTSGNCVDGVCCMDSGCPTCQACNINGGGTCAPVASGPEPHNRCTPSPPCGNTGTCTGGACTQGSASTPCGLPQSCQGMTYQPPSSCSGGGTCSQASPQTCGLYVCDTDNTCRLACGSDSHCIAGHYCTSSGKCELKKALGDPCGADGECSSTYCTEGYCCELDVCPMCQSCALGAMRGTCTQVAAGQPDPSLTCVDMTPASCGMNGLCNAGGTCDRYPAGTECARECDGTNVTHTLCDDTGICGGLSFIEICLSLTCNMSTDMCSPLIPN